jgi:hypothetical protein
MDETVRQVSASLVLINMGIFFVFETLYTLALDDNNFYSIINENAVILSASVVLMVFLIITGTRGLIQNKEKINTQGKLKYFELIPNALGFILMGTGIYYSSIYISKTVNNGKVTNLVYEHPYLSQGFQLYMIGILTILLTALLYWYLIPKQIAYKEV